MADQPPAHRQHRFARIARGMALGLCTLLLISLGFLWVRGYWVGHLAEVKWHTRSATQADQHSWGMRVERGMVRFSFRDYIILSSGDLARIQTLPQPHPTCNWIAFDPYAASDEPYITFPSDWDPDLAAHRDHPSLLYRIGFAHGFLRYPDGMNHEDTDLYAAPAWFLTLLLALWPAWWLLTFPTRRRARKIAAGLCLNCSYDLRAHRPDQKCPECGRTIEPMGSENIPPEPAPKAP